MPDRPEHRDRAHRGRLSALDVSFLYMESATTPMHVGGVAVFAAPPAALRFDQLVELIDLRLRDAPRYRQKIRWTPGRLAAPVWVDDASFDIHQHVHRIVLPAPGSPAQLYQLVGELQSRVLDRSMPLWQITVVEGLGDGGFAIVTKAHHAMADGVGATDIASVILDAGAQISDGPAAPPVQWRPQPEPTDAGLIIDSLRELAARPGAALTRLRQHGASLPTAAARTAFGLAAAMGTSVRPAPRSTLNTTLGSDRRIGVARTRLEDYRTVRHLSGSTVNDVVLAVVTGALRRWLAQRGEPVRGRGVRALVPLNVRTGPAGDLGNRLSAYVVDLPVTEPDALRRLQMVTTTMDRHKRRNESAGATAAITLAGLAPGPVHALAARTVNALSRTLFNVVISNVPGPQHPLYLAGAQVRELVPVVPLAAGQSLSIGLLSYDGGVFYGLNADRDAVPDVDRLAVLIESELAGLVDLAHAPITPRIWEEHA